MLSITQQDQSKKFAWPVHHFLMVLGILVLLPGATSALSAGPALLRAESGVLRQGGGPASLALPVEVSGVQELGAVTVVVAYEADRLAVAHCQPNPVFDVGVCNPAWDQDSNGYPDAVRFSVVSVSGLSAVEDALSLATITWEPAAPFTNTVTSTLELTVSTFTDVGGVPMGVSTENGQVTILPPYFVFLPCVLRGM